MSSPFLIRLRGTADGIVDLAGNSWTINGSVTSDSNGIYFPGNSSSYINMTDVNKMIDSGEDFTLSYWAMQEYPITYSAVGVAIVPSIVMWQYTPENTMNSGVASTSEWQLNNLTQSMYAVNNRIHVALVRYNNVITLYVNGLMSESKSSWFSNLSLSDARLGITPASMNNSYYAGYLQDICLIKGKALWTSNFTPPTGWLTLNSVIYLSGQEAWGINESGNFAKLSNNYSAITSAEKIAMFKATNGQVPTIAQLKTLTMPIKAVSYNDENEQPSCTVTAISEPQTITQKDRINLIKYNKITSVAITNTTSGNGIIKLAVTKDNTTYQVYDTTNLEWKPISINDISTDGMSVSDIESLTSVEWALLDCMDTGLGFAYYLEMKDTTDSASIADISINVEVMGPLKSLVKGTDYDYEYVGIDVLQVKLYKNGDFRINYNPG